MRQVNTLETNSTCACCGMVTSGPLEFHPYAACLMFKGCRNGNVVRANLQFVVEYGKQLAQYRHEHESAGNGTASHD